MNTPNIPPALDAEIYRLHQAGQNDTQIAGWLKDAHNLDVGRLAVLRARKRYVARTLQAEARGAPPAPEVIEATLSPEPLAADWPAAPPPEPAPAAPALVAVETAPISDEDLLGHIGRDLARSYEKARQVGNEELKLAHAAVLTKVLEVRRKIRKDRADKPAAGAAAVKGYLQVSPDDWPDPGSKPN